MVLNALGGMRLPLTGPVPLCEEVLGSNRVTRMLRNPHHPVPVFKLFVLVKHPVDVTDLDASDPFRHVRVRPDFIATEPIEKNISPNSHCQSEIQKI